MLEAVHNLPELLLYFGLELEGWEICFQLVCCSIASTVAIKSAGNAGGDEVSVRKMEGIQNIPSLTK